MPPKYALLKTERSEVDALLNVARPFVKVVSNRDVDEAKSPCVRERVVDVALVLTPKLVVGVHAKAAKPVIAPQETVPDEFVLSALDPEQLWMSETVRFDVDAVPK